MTQVRPQFNFEIRPRVFVCGADLFNEVVPVGKNLDRKEEKIFKTSSFCVFGV